MLTKVSIHDVLGSSQQVVDADLRRHDDLPRADMSMVRSAGIRRSAVSDGLRLLRTIISEIGRIGVEIVIGKRWDRGTAIRAARNYRLPPHFFMSAHSSPPQEQMAEICHMCIPLPSAQGNRLKVPGPLHCGIGLPNPSSRACPGDQDKHKVASPCPYWSPGQALPGSHILGMTFRRLPSARTKTRQAGQMPGQPRSSAVAMPDRPMFGCR